jgi:F0F1-type ATP synthase assembly protein I
MEEENNPEKGKNPKKSLSNLARFSSVGIQMGVIIGLFTWLGTYLDGKYATKTPWWTIGLSLFGVTVSLALIIREAIKMSKEDE